MPEQPDNVLSQIPQRSELFIVGLGASAGGVETLSVFFENVPANSGMAYVVILHLSPDYDSKLQSILQAVTAMPVIQVTDKTHVQRDHVYVISPNHHLSMNDGYIIPSVNMEVEDRRAPVDIFFRTLAESHTNKAIAVVLSGTGANGSMGIKRIKERGGAVFVQNPREAIYNEMPRNSIATDLIDDVMNVAEMPARIISYRDHLGTNEIAVAPEERTEDEQHALREIFLQLRLRTSHDFTNYKRPTLLRRIERRINIRNLPSLSAYASYIRETPEETTALLKDLLISVTNFFRDKSAFEYLEKEVLPGLIKDKKEGDSLRIWVAGCATGEEAYSLAMLCAERTLGYIDAPKIQIFATDIDEAAISHAREGLYTLNDAADVSPERLRRFFVKELDEYRIRREIREMILFASHNVLKDPPFSHIDLITCRNMLIYLNQTGQERVMETFHFALNPGSFLFLGNSESADGASDLYAIVNREFRIYQSRAAGVRPYPIPESVPAYKTTSPSAMETLTETKPANERISYGDLHQRLLEKYAPPSVIVNEEYDILHLSESAGRFLQISGGEPSRNLLKLVRPELRLELRSALYQAVQKQSNVEVGSVRLFTDNKEEFVNLQVRPVFRSSTDTARGFILVVFEPGAKLTGEEHTIITVSDNVSQQLEEELQTVKLQLRTTSEQYEMQAEEMKASNEELQALNEELRSAAEELETSKEELQSINEELRTVNQELKVKIDETSIASNNLQNFINSTDIGTIFLDRSLRVNLFTPAARQIYNLIPSDYGRSLSDITTRLNYENILSDAEQVLQTLKPVEKEVETQGGETFLMRITPYRTLEDRINGAVVSFINITERRRAEELMRESESRQSYLVSLNDATRPLSAAADIVGATAETAREFFKVDRCYYCEIDGDLVIIRRDAHRSGISSIAREYSMSEMPMLKSISQTGQPIIVHDVRTSAVMDENLRQQYMSVGIQAYINIPVIKGGNLIGNFCLTQSAPRVWKTGEVNLAVETAERTWAAVERAKTEEALGRSEEKYRTIFNSISEGFSLLDIQFDEKGNAYDVIIRDANPAQERIDGTKALIGQRVRDSLPGIEMKWIERYAQIARTGESAHFTDWSEANQHWYEVSASRIGGEGSTLVAIVYNDITDRKRTEANLAFLAEISQDLTRMTRPDDTLKVLGPKIGAHFNVARSMFVEILGNEERAIIRDWSRPGLAGIGGEVMLSQFLDERYHEKSRAEETIIVQNVHTSPLVDGKQVEDHFGVTSFINIPIVKNGKWVFTMGIHDILPRVWREDEVALLKEITTHIWTRLERVRAEDALATSEEKYRTLFNSIDEGFVLGEIVLGDDGTPVDYRILDMNPAYEKLTGLKREDVINKTAREIMPGIEESWIETVGKVVTTGESIRYENFVRGLDKWFETFLSPIGGMQEGHFVAVFKDVTERRRSEERQAFRLTLTDAIRTLDDPLAIQETAARLLGEKVTASRVMYAEIQGRGKERQYVVARNYLAPGVTQQLIGSFSAALFGTSLLQNGEVGKTMVVDDIRTDSRISETEREAFINAGILSFIMKPLVKEGEWVAAIAVHQVSARTWKPQEIEFVEEVAERTWSSVERAHAEEALKYSETRLRIVAKSSGIGTWIRHLDKDGIETDERTDELYGLPLANYTLVDSTRLLLHPDDIGSFTDDFEEATKPDGNGVLNTEFRIHRPPTGELRWLHSVGQTFFEGEPKRPVMMVGSSVDITDRKEADRIIRESEERYRAIFSQATAGVSEMDTEGNVLLVNQTFCRSLRYTFDEMVTMNIRDFTHPDDVDYCIFLFNEAIRTGTSYTNEKRLMRSDGSCIWVAESISVTKDETGATKSLIAVGIDITERRKSESFIHESEERYRIALEAGELATWDWNLKTDKVSWNEQHFQLFGVHHPGGTIDPEYFLEFIYPEDLALVKQQLTTVVSDSGIYSAEFRIRRRDNGKLRWMTGYGRVTEREDGKPTRISGVMFDSTERREAEDNLEATRNSLSTALEAASMGVWTKDMTHGYMDRSVKHDLLLGFTEWQEEWDDDKGKTNIIDEDKPKFDAARKNLIDNGIFDLEARVKHNDGTVCWVHYFGRTFRNEDGKGETAAGVIFDITDQKTIEKQKDDFIGIASHELKTPVTSIKAYAEILQEMFEEANDKRSADLMGKLDSQVDRLTNLIKDLLDVTKVSEGQLHLVTKPFNIETTIQNVTEEMQRTTRSHTIRLTMQSLPEVAGDEERIAQVLVNMMSNAIKYSPEAKEVLVNAKYEDGKVSVSVQDFGIGMSPGTLEKLFARFFRSDNPTIRSFPGLGLGLFISMEIMKRHSGTISVESERGKGSIFTMVLPVA